MAFKGAGGKVVESVTDPKGQTGYKVQSIQIRAERQVIAEDQTEVEVEASNSFEYLENAMFVAITKINKGEWSQLEPEDVKLLEEMLASCSPELINEKYA